MSVNSHPGSHAEPRKRPVQARSRQTVESILVAAARILAERGYLATTTNDVADAAGVSIGSLYQYFPNKDSLLVRARGAPPRRRAHDARGGGPAVASRSPRSGHVGAVTRRRARRRQRQSGARADLRHGPTTAPHAAVGRRRDRRADDGGRRPPAPVGLAHPRPGERRRCSWSLPCAWCTTSPSGSSRGAGDARRATRSSASSRRARGPSRRARPEPARRAVLARPAPSHIVRSLEDSPGSHLAR